ncbi:MAG: biotin--[acetyl-CoA-carboxylase] ligase [Deltaproteobacteria bacterium]|nr:biotin--[acetyl-CoA-carboxylase] ligase [Deltaproteobacteria bacterium]
MNFDEQSLARCLSGKKIGSPVYFFREVDSTNDVAFGLASSGAAEGTAVIADHQKEGKGRLSRRWQSPPGCNLYTSLVLRPAMSPSVAPQITLMAGVVMAELIAQFCPGKVELKWPNDVMIRGKKVCGILTEMKASVDQGVEFIIAGIGINVNMKKEEFDEAFRDVATSLREEAGTEISRLDFTVNLYEKFEHRYFMLLREGFEPIKDRWLEYADIVGKYIKVRFNEAVQAGNVIGIDAHGALLLRDESNHVRRIMAGDASIIRG